MPPVPPARRASEVAAPGRPFQWRPKHKRFILLYLGDPVHPSTQLGQAAFDRLPPRCRVALQAVVTDPSLDPTTRAMMEAYYASGHKPIYINGMPSLWTDKEIALHLMALPDGAVGGIAALLEMCPITSDSGLSGRLASLVVGTEPKGADKITLEAIRLAMQLKGHLREEKQEVTQATQIIIHTSQEPTIKPAEQPRVIEIDL